MIIRRSAVTIASSLVIIVALRPFIINFPPAVEAWVDDDLQIWQGRGEEATWIFCNSMPCLPYASCPHYIDHLEGCHATSEFSLRAHEGLSVEILDCVISILYLLFNESSTLSDKELLHFRTPQTRNLWIVS